MSASIRRWLESPLLGRPIWTLFFVPILLPFSYFIALCAFVRRNFLFAIFRKKHFPFPIVCVGNVAMGGTGKSPIVRAIAESFVKNGFAVAIVSRGVGGRGCAFVAKEHLAGLALFNDENREHWQTLEAFLKSESGQGSVVVAQNANRVDAVDAVQSYWNLNANTRRQNRIVILDDGLQNLSVPRDREICVWHASTVTAPDFCFPLGPYREVGFRNFAQRFAFHFFSDEGSRKKIEDRFAFKFDSSRVVIVKRSFFYNEVKISRDQIEGESLRLSEVTQQDVNAALKLNSNVLAVAGIARPEIFFRQLHVTFGDEIQTLPLPDHNGQLLEVTNLQEDGVVITTAKDFYRWSMDNDFRDLISAGKQKWFVVSLRVELLASDGEPFNMLGLVGKTESDHT